MKDGAIFFAIGAVLDLIGRKAGSCWYKVRTVFFTKQTKRMQVLAGIRKKEDL